MLGTVYIRDINFAFQNSQDSVNIFASYGVEYRIFFYRLFALFVVCLPGVYRGFVHEFCGQVGRRS